MRPPHALLAIATLLVAAYAFHGVSAHGTCVHSGHRTWVPAQNAVVVIGPSSAATSLPEGPLALPPPPLPPGKTAAKQAENGLGVTVEDTSVGDCNGDGMPGEFDGDYDFGTGGVAIGHGPWASTCGMDALGSFVSNLEITAFFIGADDAGGNTVPCLTDGLIAPTVDTDDCLGGPYVLSASIPCQGGGDGLVWVFASTVTIYTDGSGNVVDVDTVAHVISDMWIT